jgi:hypothetical protein
MVEKNQQRQVLLCVSQYMVDPELEYQGEARIYLTCLKLGRFYKRTPETQTTACKLHPSADI